MTTFKENPYAKARNLVNGLIFRNSLNKTLDSKFKHKKFSERFALANTAFLSMGLVAQIASMTTAFVMLSYLFVSTPVLIRVLASVTLLIAIEVIKQQSKNDVMQGILEKAYWDKSKQADSNYVKRIRGAVPKSYLDYFLRRNEIFARLFEQYIAHKLKALKIQNVFLTKTKYHAAQYMTPTEMKAVVPLFDKLLVEMRKYF